MRLATALAPKSAWFRRTTLAVSAVLVVALMQTGAAPPSPPTVASNLPGLPAAEKPVAGTNGIKVKPRATNKGPRIPAKAPQAKHPKPSQATVAVPQAGAQGSKRFAAVKGQPIGIGRTQSKAGLKSKKSADEFAPSEVVSRVLDAKKAEEAGVNGLLFTLSPSGETPAGATAAKPAKAPVAVTVDYADFAESFGGSYASRMRLVELPACVLTTPDEEKCRTSDPVVATNDTAQQTLTAKSVNLQAGTPTVLAATAAAAGDKGDYKATSLSPSSTWKTNLNTGDFTWSYVIPTPEVPGGLEPRVGLSYSSGSIDGRTGGTNNQGSWVGDGFDLWPGFIERRYKPCADDGVENADGNKPGDMCWAYDNAFISFNGSGGELVPAGNDEFKLKRDDGTRITRLESADRGNGDNDNEYWRLTAPNGTQYYFGYNRLPGWTAGAATTDSTWTLPVYGNNAGEECHGATFADSWCQQGWRWNLDYVVDTHGNAISYHYTKESNSYGRNLKADDDTPYTRGGSLKRIDYGQRSSDLYATKPLSQVVFGSTERCLPQTGVTCAADTIDADAFYWYDTPWDLNCKAGTSCDNGRLSPSFWTRKRLTDITTQVLQSDGTYGQVDSWRLAHRWGMADTDYQLLLDSIQHTGKSASPAITLPKTTFAYTQLANRLDKTGDGFAPFIKDRLSTVDDEYGGQVSANYSAAPCDWGALPTPETNTTGCFPQYIGGDDSDPAELHWFNKYVTTSVTTTDRTGGAPDQVTKYQYMGDAAWHYADDDGLTKEKEKTWSQWRGYGQVRVQTGGLTMKTQQDSYFLRGMDGDRKEKSGGTKSVSVTLASGEGDAITDHEAAVGFHYKTATFDKPGGKLLGKTVNRPWHHETAKKVRDWGTVTANFTGTSSTREWVSLDSGAGSEWRVTSKETNQDTVAGRVVQIDDLGDESIADDDQCTRTTYPGVTSMHILDIPSRVETVAKACSTTPDRSKDVLVDVRTAYDGAVHGASPTKGDATAVAVLKSHDGTEATYLESGATFDSYGRQLTTTDLAADLTVIDDGVPVRTARSDGRTMTTEYIPATGVVAQVKVTTPPAKTGDATTAQTSVTTLDPLRGNPVKTTDTNSSVTEVAYDALGRSAKVWLADRRNTQTPTHEFVYTIAENKAAAVATKSLDNNGGQITSYELYDGYLRGRQTQAPGPADGSIITDTFYDERGLEANTFAPYYTTSKPSTDIFAPDDALSVETQTQTTYDGLNRAVETRQIAGNGSGGTVLNTTKNIYDGDRTTVIPPVGGTATTALLDARGHTTELRQHHTRAADTEFDKTSYHYTPNGKLESVTDPAGNSWSYEYDQLGRVTSIDDPDKGTTANTYDDRGQLTFSKGSRTDVPGLAYVYDGLGRQTEVREGSATGTLRTKQVYDTVLNAKGQLAESTRYVNGQAYTSKVTAYDRLYRPSKTAVAIPAAEGKLQGTYQTGTAYFPSGLTRAVSYSAAGSLPGGSSNYTYEDQTLRPIAVFGEGMTSSTSYSLTGKPLQYAMGLTSGGGKTQVTNTYEWGTQRLATSRVDRQDQPGVDRHVTYGYDEVGNVLSMADVSRTGTDNQCFQYDYLSRLTEAWTQPITTCATAPAGDEIGGPAPYWRTFTYDQAGNRTTETRHSTTGEATQDVKRTYAYPVAGTAQAHTLTALTTEGPSGTTTEPYTYDPSGNTTARPGQSLTWDAEGHLGEVTENGKTTTYLYDAAGNRLIGRTATEATLYLGHTEVVLPTGAEQAKATRYFDLGGGQSAIRSDDGTFAFTIADHQGTGELAVEAADLSVTQRRTLPFGATRGQAPPAWPSTKGFVGGTDDTKTTGLTHLGAREYDPTTGRFLSVDPVMDLADPQQFNGYSYANNNPVTLSDPAGLMPVTDCWRGCTDGDDTYRDWMTPNANGTWSYHYENSHYVHDVTGDLHSVVKTGSAHPPLGKRIVVKPYDLKAQEVVIKALVTTFLPDPSAWKDCATGSGVASCLIAGTDLPIAKALKLVPDSVIKKGAKAAEEWLTKVLKKCKCFLAGTDVLMADGTTKNIEDIEAGDMVLATDPETGKTTARTVTRHIVTDDDKFFNELSITTENGIEKLTATHEHPFWSPSEHDWVPAGKLKPGMTLLTDDGTTVIVARNHPFTKRARTYNLTVDDVHTYYVLAGATPVLVHNSNCGDVILGPGEGTADALRAFTSTKPETEFVFDSGAGRFLAGDRERIPGGLSPHEQLAEKAGMDRGTVLGGTLFRDNGRLVFTENSGHYGHRWTDATRQQFQKFMSDQGIDFDYRPWG